jgi:CHAT domain-containing protein
VGDDVGPTARELVDSLWSIPGHRARLRRLRGLKDRYDDGLVLELRRAAELELRKDPREAGRRAQLGLVVAEALGDARGTILCLIERTKAAVACGNFRFALESIAQASVLAQELDDEALRAQLDLLRLHPLISLERYTEARADGERVLAVFERRGDAGGRVLTRMALADLAFRLDRPREALRHYAEVDRIMPPTAHVLSHAVLAVNRANSLDAANRFRAAARHFDRARALFDSASSRHAVAEVEYNAAYSEMLRGRYQDALRRYAACEAEFRRMDDERHLAHVDLDRAEIHLHLNLPEDAAQFAAAAEARFETLGLAKERAQAAQAAAQAAEMREDAAAANQGYERAQMLFLSLGLSERAFSCVVARACVAERAGDRATSRRLADEARALATDGMNPLSRAALDLLIARLDLLDGERDAARARAESVLDDCRRIHSPPSRIEALRIVGRSHVLAKDTAPAIAVYRLAVDELERWRGGVPPDEYMTAFLGGRSALYEEVVDVLVLAGDAEAALEYAERAKSRALVDLLAGRHDRGAVAGDAGPSARRVRYLRERLNAVYQQLLRRDGDNDVRSSRFLRESRERAREIEQEISGLLRRRRALDPKSASLDAVETPDVASLRERLEPDEAVVEYFVAKDALYVFALTKDDVHVVRRDATRAELTKLLDRFGFHLARGEHARSPNDDLVLRATRANLEALSELLIAPIADAVAGARRLVVVPHDGLHQLPFHALPWKDGWLCDAHEIVYAPSAAVYGYCRDARPTATGPAAVFGLPDAAAPRIEDEVRRVAQVLGDDSKLYLRDEATFERLAEEAGRARLLHVATHGMFRHEHPMLSSIRLADRWVNLYDLYGLTVKGELVVLSTCESGVAKANGANEILGLTRGFLYAGAPALLTSQWPVDDAVTCRFMERFHEALRDGEGAAAAHRRAMADVRRDLPHPYFWAPFFLTGRPADPRRPARSASAAEAATGLSGLVVGQELAATGA